MEESKSIEGECPIQFTLNLIGGKWKLVMLWHLSIDGVMRYGEIKKSLSEITHKMLSQQLKELEADGFVHREEYHQIPPKVEYSLTDLGKSLLPILQSIFNWGKDNMS
jgi:DNA-binding HxlR family transcriptional regulator